MLFETPAIVFNSDGAGKVGIAEADVATERK